MLIANPVAPTTPNLASWIQLCGRRSASAVLAPSADTRARVLRAGDCEVADDGVLDAGDRLGRRPEPDRQHRHERIRRLERAVAAAAEVMAAREVVELPAGRSGDEHLTCVWVCQRRGCAQAAVGNRIEDRVVLVAVASRDD